MQKGGLRMFDRIRTTAAGAVVGLAALGFAYFSTIGTAQAVPALVLDGFGKMTGISALDIGGTDYDVAFAAAGQSYNQAVATYGQGQVFATTGAAFVAEQAVANFLNGAGASADDMAWGTGSDANFHTILFAFSQFTTPGATVDAYDVTWVPPFAPNGWFADNGFFAGLDPDFQSIQPEIWAIFTETSANVAVPAPATALVLGIGLIAFARLRRRGRGV